MRIFSRRLIFPIMLIGVVSAAAPLLFARHSTVADDPVVGVWNLIVAKSKFASGPAPKSQTRTYETHQNGIKATINTVSQDGKSTTIQYVASYDSVEYPVTGSLRFDAIAMKRIDESTAEAKLIHAGKEIASARRVISEDGQTMTVTFEMNVGGGTVTNVSVFEKQGKW